MLNTATDSVNTYRTTLKTTPVMKAARFHGRGDIRVEEIEEPTCGKGQVKVRFVRLAITMICANRSTIRCDHRLLGSVVVVSLRLTSVSKFSKIFRERHPRVLWGPCSGTRKASRNHGNQPTSHTRARIQRNRRRSRRGRDPCLSGTTSGGATDHFRSRMHVMQAGL